ncbi:MAG: glycoside hydrolase family 99-like domain-containing protein [Oligoflexia bacterium]|nr:glycoside hydrolase family 99-like domain-containing protein [Oligoflexia bacterium]
MKLILLWFLALLVYLPNAQARPSVGAIRWDYWFGGSPYSPLITQAWDLRRPASATRNNDGTINMQLDRQEVVDQEILDASNAGIDYFSYVSYIGYDGDGLTFGPNRALAYHLKSNYKSKMKFSLILSSHHLGLTKSANNHTAWEKTKKIILSFVERPEFMRVNSKPLIYFMDAEIFENYWGSSEEARQKLSELKTYIESKTGQTPIVVALSWTNYHWNLLANKIPNFFDGVTSYANAPTFDNTDANGFNWGQANVEIAYADLEKGCVGRDRKFRNSFNQDVYVVPSITTGWDERPLKGTDPYYQRDLKNSWCSHAKPEEIANHVAETLNWVEARSKNLNTVLMYAWNEYLEGGFLAPMVQDGDARLKALEKVLKTATVTQPLQKVLKKETLQFASGGVVSITNNCAVSGDYPNTCKAELNIGSVTGGVIAMTVKSEATNETLAACFLQSGGNYSAPWINYNLKTKFKTYLVSNCTTDSYLSGKPLYELSLSFVEENVGTPITPITPVVPIGPQLQVTKQRFSGSSSINLINNCSEAGDYANTCAANFQITSESSSTTIIYTVESSASGQEVMATCFNAATGGSYRAPWINYGLKTTFRTYKSSNCLKSDIKSQNRLEQSELWFK